MLRRAFTLTRSFTPLPLRKVYHTSGWAPIRTISSAIDRPDAEFVVERLQGHDEGIVVLSLNRPRVKNALGKQLMASFKDTLSSLRFDKSSRVIILRSIVDGAFCSGADLKERVEMQPKEVASFVHLLRTTFTDLETLPQPTIAAIDGIALGGGTELALACDLRVASKASKLGLPETGLAIIPGAGGSQRLPRLIGRARAKELIFTAAVIDSSRALSLGLIEHETEPGLAYLKALDIARQILTKGPVAIHMAKIAIDRGMDMDTTSGMILEQQCYAQVIPTQDRLEGLKAFKEKRVPKYTGM
eukprot:TRINITY_DN6245_c0_g1_i1.p1 TRINITY_DN6245_c0_g1~~TRINITY_DN6245_c0_g1_i1.p1  ORF type:complete len:302 (-),score=67.16 TRINITY_DN6245_c0_g1_i1:38-943(-)